MASAPSGKMACLVSAANLRALAARIFKFGELEKTALACRGGIFLLGNVLHADELAHRTCVEILIVFGMMSVSFTIGFLICGLFKSGRIQSRAFVDYSCLEKLDTAATTWKSLRDQFYDLCDGLTGEKYIATFRLLMRMDECFENVGQPNRKQDDEKKN